MTKVEKEQVRLLRENGYSYTQISTRLNLSVNTVRSHCSRNAIEVKDHREIRFCVTCGAPISGNKEKYCSRRCKSEWWNTHPKRQKGQVEKACSCCGRTFYSYPYQNRKYCSHACYIKQRFTCNNIETE